MVEFTSFPESSTHSPKTTGYLGLNFYGKVRDAASHVISTLAPVDSAQPGSDHSSPSRTPPAQSPQSPSGASTPRLRPLKTSLPVIGTPSGSQLKTSILDSTWAKRPSVSRGRESSVGADSYGSSSYGSSNYGAVKSGRHNGRHNSLSDTLVPLPERWQPSSSSSSRASATYERGGFRPSAGAPLVGVTESASTPTLAVAPSNSARHDGDHSDSESIMSTMSYSRAYLATQYDRSRQRSRGSLSRDFWMKDENANSCFRCSKPFTTFRRRHHCRICGQIFCGSCTSLVPGSHFGQRDGRVRCCLTCTEHLNDDHSSSEEEDTIVSSFMSSPPGTPIHPVGSKRFFDDRRSTSVGTPQHSVQFATHHESTPLSSSATGHAGHSNSHTGSHTGSHTMGQTTSHTSHTSHTSQPSQIGAQSGGLQPDPGSPTLPQSPLSGTSVLTDNDYDSDGGYAMDGLNSTSLGAPASVLASGAIRTPALRPRSNTNRSQRSLHFSSAARFPPQPASIELGAAAMMHADRFLERLLKDSELSLEWKHALLPILIAVTSQLHLELMPDRVDPRQWVKMKRVCGGSMDDIELLNGTVFTHALAKRNMAPEISQPRILIITFPIEYSRGQGSYMSLEPILAQEHEFLRKLVARIESLRPTIILSTTRIADMALQMLASAGIAVATHVRDQAVQRLSRYTQADILTSVDKLSLNPRLGSCAQFERRVYRQDNTAKAYLFFSGVPTGSGYTIVLRGPPDDLSRVKRAMEMMVDVVFSLKMETSLMRDQFAMWPAESDDSVVLSSSPYIDYGTPYLKLMSDRLEDSVVKARPDSVGTETELPDVKALPGPEHEAEPKALPAPETKAEPKDKDAKPDADNAHQDGKDGQNQEIDPEMDKMDKKNGNQEQEEKEEDEKEKEATGGIGRPLKPVDWTAKAAELGIDTAGLPGGLSMVRKIVQEVQEARHDSIYQLWNETHKLWDQVEEQNPGIFIPEGHQNLVLLFMLESMVTGSPCVGPEPLMIEFYTESDLTLGQWVENICQTYNDACPDDCGQPLHNHKRLYVHGSGQLTVHIEPLECPIPGMEQTILMWDFCHKCDTTLPVVPMSPTTWKYSLGKYFELAFWGKPLSLRAGMCPHNLYRDHVRYFGWHNLAVRIEYAPIKLLDIVRPEHRLTWDSKQLVNLKNETYRTLQQEINRFWDSVLVRVNKVKVEGLDDEKLIESTEMLKRFRGLVDSDRAACLEQLDTLYVTHSPTDILSLNEILIYVQSLTDRWHREFALFDGLFFPTEKDIRRVTAQQLRSLFLLDEGDRDDSQPEREKEKVSEKVSEKEKNEKSDKDKSEKDRSEKEKEKEKHEGDKTVAKLEQRSVSGGAVSEAQAQPCRPPPARRASYASSLGVSPRTVAMAGTNVSSRTPNMPPLPGMGSRQNSVTSLSGRSIHGLLPPPAQSPAQSPQTQTQTQTAASSSAVPAVADSPALSPVRRNKSYSGTMADLYNSHKDSAAESTSSPSVRLQSKFGNNIDLSVESLQGTMPRPMPAASPNGPRVALLVKHFEELSKEFERERLREQERLRDRQESTTLRHTQPVAEVFQDVEAAVNEDWNDEDGESEADGPLAASAQSTSSMARSGQQDDGSTHSEVDGEEESDSARRLSRRDSLPKTERTSLIKSLVNFWAERSSTRWSGIEYMLAPNEHLFSDSLVVIREDEPSSVIAFCLSLPDHQARVRSLYPHGDESPVLEQVMLKQTGVHLRYYFEERQTKISCKIFFSEQFDALRRQCGASQRYVQSLSRCFKWDSSGGKSGSSFLKTRDERLIIKELSQAEFDAFVSFAPSYFEYSAQSLFHDLPTVLAKIFGFYQIQIRHAGRQMKIYVMVMENLFYGRKFTRIFDLKGSMRNRKVTETGKANEVLLDENMVEYIHEHPMYVREHTKKMLRTSLYNDTLFLTKMNVMDYSLVIAIDEETSTIVAGIVDFVRTYTWDKKIESWVKGYATNRVKEPTVISPKQYKVRFRESMERYFMMVPDCWQQMLSQAERPAS